MASDSSSNSGIVAIFAIMMIVLVAGFLAWRAGVFGGGSGGNHKLDVNITSPSK